MESVLDDLLGSVGKPMRLGRQAPAEYIVSLEQGDPNTALSQYGRRDTPSDTAADNNGRHVAAYPHRTDGVRLDDHMGAGEERLARTRAIARATVTTACRRDVNAEFLLFLVLFSRSVTRQ